MSKEWYNTNDYLVDLNETDKEFYRDVVMRLLKWIGWKVLLVIALIVVV